MAISYNFITRRYRFYIKNIKDILILGQKHNMDTRMGWIKKLAIK